MLIRGMQAMMDSSFSPAAGIGVRLPPAWEVVVGPSILWARALASATPGPSRVVRRLPSILSDRTDRRPWALACCYP